MTEQKLSKNIVLIGFMGSGKSTIARTLCKMQGMEIVEMDETIEEREQMPISQIFATKGEPYFRDLETNLLIEMQSKNGVVISCGGGVPMRDRNVVEMKKNGSVFLLTAKPETIYNRVKDFHNRPLLENNMSVSYIEELMEKRKEKYEAAADYIIHTDNKTAEIICEEILKLATPIIENQK